MDFDFLAINQLRDRLEEQARHQRNRAATLSSENHSLKETVKMLIHLLYEKGVLTEQESAALISQSSLDERLAVVQDDPAQEPEHPDVSPELQALADQVDEINPDERPIGER